MKALEFSLSESVYASLVTGHARAGNMEAAKKILTNMKASNQRPHNATYTSLLCAHAEKGDMEAIEKVRGSGLPLLTIVLYPVAVCRDASRQCLPQHADLHSSNEHTLSVRAWDICREGSRPPEEQGVAVSR